MLPKKLSLEMFQQQYFQPVFELEKFMSIDGESSLYKFLPYWRRNKLLPFIPKGDWGLNVSLSQLIWLRILDNLRALGYPVASTEKVTNYFFKDAYFDELPSKNLQELKKQLEEKRAKGISEPEDEQVLAEVDYILGDKMLLYGLKFDVSYLSNLVIWCVRVGKEAGILIFPKGEVIEKRGEQFFRHSELVSDVERPHIYISIKALLDEFVDNKELANIVVPHLLEDEERIVLKELRKKNVKELRIVVQSEKIVRIDTQTKQTITADQAEEVKRILRMKNYEEVTISTRDNRTINFNRTNKIMTSGKPGSKD